MGWIVSISLHGVPDEIVKTFTTKKEALDYILEAQKREHHRGIEFKSTFKLRKE